MCCLDFFSFELLDWFGWYLVLSRPFCFDQVLLCIRLVVPETLPFLNCSFDVLLNLTLG